MCWKKNPTHWTQDEKFDPADIAKQFENHLKSSKHTWLLGAGTSFGANIPPMKPLTNRVLKIAREERFGSDEELKKVIDFIEEDVGADANIEAILTHLCDLTSMASRSYRRQVVIEEKLFQLDKLTELHNSLLEIISNVICWGYKEASLGGDGQVMEEELIGTIDHPIVLLNDHLSFIEAIFGTRRAGLDPIRSPVQFFTTNYDTLLEDALALNQISYEDGFEGGAVAFWKGGAYHKKTRSRAIVTKLHGSIDWYRPPDNPSQLFRIRMTDKYPEQIGTVMIYPQATKYLQVHQDPFAEMLTRFRKRLRSSEDQVLLICGYSFGDEHINAEIEDALSSGANQLTLLALTEEQGNQLPAKLEEWRTNANWGQRVLIASSKGLYQGSSPAAFSLPSNGHRDWWTFSGITKLLSDGLPTDVRGQLQ